MRKKVAIGIPCFAGVSPEVLEDYMRFAYHLGRRYLEYDFFLMIKAKSEQFRARNAIVESAIIIGADYLLMMDDDHIINIDNDVGNPEKGAECYDFLRKLIDHNVDIVGPVYFQRGGSAKPVVMEEDECGGYRFVSDIDLGSGLQERDVQGGGCMLIDMKVFDKIKSPWFEPEFSFGTDVQICRKASEAGFKVYNDTDIEIGHLVNERAILTSKNRHQFRSDKVLDQTPQEELDWKTNSILHKYKYDAVEFLGIKENDADEKLADLASRYEYMCLNTLQTHPVGSRGYYANMGPEQLARQVLIHHSTINKQNLATILREIVPNKLNGMDFGCGSGPVGFELAKRGGFMCFEDIDGGSAYEFLKWRCKKYGLTNVSFEEPEKKSLHYIICLDSIEHLENWEETLDRLYAYLVPNGNLMTNFMRITDSENDEHVFMDRPAFMGWVAKKNMLINSDCIFIKR